MKYITPEIFQSENFQYTMASIKEELNQLENGKGNCYDSWKSKWSSMYPVCAGNIDMYVIRHYSRRWDWVNHKVIKAKYIDLKLYCEMHKPKRCRKATQKELFYIKIC